MRKDSKIFCTKLFIKLYCMAKSYGYVDIIGKKNLNHINFLQPHTPPHIHTHSIHQRLWFYFYISHLGIHGVYLQPHALCHALATSNHVDDKLAVEMCLQHLSLM